MLVFLNIDCLTRTQPAATGPVPGEPIGLPGFESVLDAWPQLRLVITSDCRYWMTIEQLRSRFARPHRPRVIATTLRYGALATRTALTREQEVLDWLHHADVRGADWLALDHRVDDFPAHPDRLVACPSFDRLARDRLHARLLQRASRQQAVARFDAQAFEPAREHPHAIVYADKPDTRSSSQAGRPR